jgi:hypothetical protein
LTFPRQQQWEREMRYEISFGSDAPDVVTFTAMGAADGNAFARGVEELVGDQRFRPGMPILFDDSLSDVKEVSADAVRSLAGHFVRLGPQLGSGRAAMLVSQPLMYGLARMFETYAGDAPLTFGVFYVRDEALKWLLDGNGAEAHAGNGSPTP